MQSYRTAPKAKLSLKRQAGMVAVQAPRQRCGHTTIMLLVEVLLLGLLIWGVLYAVPRMIFHGSANAEAEGGRLHKPILRLVATSNGSELWGQLGTSEIVSIDVTTRKTRSVHKRNRGPIGHWCVSQDGETMLLSDNESEIQIRRHQELMVVDRLSSPTSLLTELSANGTGVIRISGGKTARYWNLSNDDPTEVDFILKETAEKIGIDSAGDRLAVAAGRNGLQIYDLKSGTLVRELEEYSSFPKCPAFSPDGKWLAVIRGLSVALFNLDSGEVTWTVKTPSPAPCFCMSFSPDGKWLAASGVTAGIQIIDCSTGQMHCEFPTNQTLHRIVFSPTQPLLYSGSTDGLIRIWSVATGQVVEQLSLYDENRKSSP